MIARTACGTARCEWCKAEWISSTLDVHADPVCLMHLLVDAPE